MARHVSAAVWTLAALLVCVLSVAADSRTSIAIRTASETAQPTDQPVAIAPRDQCVTTKVRLRFWIIVTSDLACSVVRRLIHVLLAAGVRFVRC